MTSQKTTKAEVPIRLMRLAHGLTQAEIAEILGVTSQTVWLWETRRLIPGAPIVSALQTLDATLRVYRRNEKERMKAQDTLRFLLQRKRGSR